LDATIKLLTYGLWAQIIVWNRQKKKIHR